MQDKNDEVEQELQKIAQDPDFIMGAVSYFPNYKHKESDEQEAKTKKLRVLIFMF
jgi:hypothetical protein